jgi:nuclear transport factor 2 (NTF2) superfamily protein
MNTKKKQIPTPPWEMDTAAVRLLLLEDDFNSSDPESITANFTEHAEVRFGLSFLTGREELKQFLVNEFSAKKTYKLKFDLWGALKGRMAVRSELEWSDAEGRKFKNYGVQVFQFDDNGYITNYYVSFNDEPAA